jgi:hypothetical protein
MLPNTGNAKVYKPLISRQGFRHMKKYKLFALLGEVIAEIVDEPD